jgi:hypothetical protein
MLSSASALLGRPPLQRRVVAAPSPPSRSGSDAHRVLRDEASSAQRSTEAERQPGGIQEFDAADETHRLWIEQVGDTFVVVVASDPMTVPQRLRIWKQSADSMAPSGLKTNILEWIEKSWKKSLAVDQAAQIEDPKQRAGKTHQASAELKEMLKRLFWAFQIDLPELGAVAVYRGIHFTKDWSVKRGSTVGQESAREFESVKAEGSYSSATWALANGLAAPGKATSTHLESANRIVLKVLEGWKETTDYTRQDASDVGREKAKRRTALDRAAALPGPQALLAEMKVTFTQSGSKFENQFAAALSRYIDNQGTFEGELAQDSAGGYMDVPFKEIPFISTTKVAQEAVKYAQGKLAKEAQRSTENTVGRVLVYVADRVDLLEAGGIDVWQRMGEGKLRFTDWRMSENEITFSGKIPDHFLRTMTPVQGGEGVDVAANRAEKAAAKAASPFGGLKPLPVNKEHI